jgi:hypothetical protein
VVGEDGKGFVVRCLVVRVGPVMVMPGAVSRQFEKKSGPGKVSSWNLDLEWVQVVGIGLGAQGE